jgi:hypothetical protein
VLIASSTDELSEATLVTKKFRYFYTALRGISLLKCLKTIETKIKFSQNPTGTNSLKKCVLFVLLYVGKSYEATKPLDKIYGILGLLRGFGVTLQLEARYD